MSKVIAKLQFTVYSKTFCRQNAAIVCVLTSELAHAMDNGEYDFDGTTTSQVVIFSMSDLERFYHDCSMARSISNVA